MRETNLSKWNRYKAIIDAHEESFLDSVGDVPSERFEVYPTGKMKRYTKTDLRYYNKEHFYIPNRVAGRDVEQIARYAAELPEPTKEQVYVGYEYEWADGKKGTGAFKLEKWVSMLSKEDAERIAQERQHQAAIDDANIEAGTHFRCGYCRKIFTAEQKN